MVQRHSHWRPLLVLFSAAILLASRPLSTSAQTVIKRGAKGPFPVQISKPGSYVIGGNLNVPTSATDAIDISTANVTIDLNGFVISGSGSGTGINASSVTNT